MPDDPTLYITEDDLASWMNVKALDFEARIVGVPAAVCRQVDRFCGRRFYADTVASTRTYPAPRDEFLFIDDCYEIESVTVDGSVVDADSYTVHPLNGVRAGIEGWPATCLEGVWSGVVAILGKWGWADVPPTVVLASKIIGAEAVRSGDLPSGFPDFADGGPPATRKAWAMLGGFQDQYVG